MRHTGARSKLRLSTSSEQFRVFLFAVELVVCQATASTMPSTQAKIDRLRQQILQLQILQNDHRELALCHLERLGRQCELHSRAQASDTPDADPQSTIALCNLDAFAKVLEKYTQLERSGEAADDDDDAKESMIHDLIDASFTEGSVRISSSSTQASHSLPELIIHKAWDITHNHQAEAGPVGDELTPSLLADPVFQCTTTYGCRKRANSAPCLLEPGPGSTSRSTANSSWSAEWYSTAHRTADPYVTIDDDVLWCELNGVDAKGEDLDLYWPEYGPKMDVVRQTVMKQVYEEGLVTAREM